MKKLADGWHEVTIEEIASVDSGQGAPQGDKWYNGEKIFIKAGDLNNLTEGKYVGDYCQRIRNEAIGYHKLKEYPANSIVFPKSGMSVKTDNIALLKYDSYVVNHLAIVKVKENLCSEKYLYYLFKWKKISNLSLNDSYPSIRLQDIKNFKILLPPLPTQKKIAAVLEKAEKLREWRKEADGLTDMFLKSTFMEMFGHPLSKNKKASKEILKNVISIIVPTRDKPKSFTGNIPWVTLPDLTDSIYIGESKFKLSKEEAKPTKTRLFPKNTVILSCAGSLGKIAIAKKEIYTNQQFYGLICNERKIIPEFLAYQLLFFGEDFFRNIGGTSTLTFFRKEVALNIGIIISDLEKQQKFASIVQQVEQVRQHQKESKQQIDHFFNVLMQRAFRGELEAK